MKKRLILFLSIICFLSIRSQNNDNVIKVNKNDLLQLSVNNTVLVYTFSVICEPCILHLKNAIDLSNKYKIDFYVLLIQKNGKLNQPAIEFLKKQKNDIKIITIKDEYSVKNNKSYKRFLKDITPKEFKNISDYSKYIVIKNKKVLMVTNYKDNEISDDWRDDTPMLKEKIIPLLKEI